MRSRPLRKTHPVGPRRPPTNHTLQLLTLVFSLLPFVVASIYLCGGTIALLFWNQSTPPPRVLPPRPSSPGKCWQFVLRKRPSVCFCRSFCWCADDPTLPNPVLRDWISAAEFKNLLIKSRTWTCQVQTIRYGVHHVVAEGTNPIPGYRVFRVWCHRLPRGWYGFGREEASFYADSPLHNVILSMHMGDYQNSLNSARRFAPYAVSKKMVPFLTKAGIQAPPVHADVSPHPVHYALHNRALSLVVPALRNAWFALYMSPARVNFLQTCGAAPPTGVYNSVNQGKDILRYGNGPLPPPPYVAARELVVPPVNSEPVWFVDDVLHHLEPGVVGSWFDTNPTLKYVFATAVIPPETCFDLPSLYPSLYTFDRIGDRLKYVPEGDCGGSYDQPYGGRRWLSTNRVITPHGECVHVSLLDTTYAHHVFVISRPQLMPEKHRLLDMAEVFVVPWYAYPTFNLYNRLTSNVLLCKLVMYGVRVSDTTMRDMGAKVATITQEVYESYPPSFVRAASGMALWLRNMDYHYKVSWWGLLVTHVGTLFRLPVVPFMYFWQAYVSTWYSDQYHVPHRWYVKCRVWVSSRSDQPLPGTRGPLCAIPLGVFQLEPNADRLAVFSKVTAEWCVFLALKFLGYPVFTALTSLVARLPELVAFLSWLLGIEWAKLPGPFLFGFLMTWYGVRGPSLSLPSPVGRLVGWAKFSYAAVWGLPYARLPVRTGVSWVYQVSLNFTVLTLAFPRLHPVIFLLEWVLRVPADSIVQAPGELPWFGGAPRYNHTDLRRRDWISDHLVEDHSTMGLLYTVNPWWSLIIRSAGFLICACHALPWVADQLLLAKRPARHCDLEHGLPPVLPPPDPEGSPPPSPPSPPADDGFDDLAVEVVPPMLLEPVTFRRDALLRQPGAEDDVPANVELRGPPTPPPRQALALPAMVPGDPLRAYDLPPRVIADYDNWVNIMTRLPDPPNNLNVQTACIWEVVSARLGVSVAKVWGCYVAHQPPAARAAYNAGTLTHDEMVRVLTFFAMDYNIRGSTGPDRRNPGANLCPRGPGGTAALGEYHPAEDPIMVGTGLPGWPSLHGFLQRNDDTTYHFTDRAQANDAIGNFVPPGPGSLIGWPSVLVPAVEVGEVLNVPGTAYASVYRRMLGWMPNFLSPWPNAGRITGVVLPALPAREQVVNYTLNAVDARFALELAQDIKSDPSVLKIHDYRASDISRMCHAMAQQLQRHVQFGGGMYKPVRLHLYHGLYGTGKTRQVVLDLAARHAVTPFTPASLAFHTWDHDLREPLRNAVLGQFPGVGLQSNNFMTGCMPLAQPRSGTVVFDDVGKAWNSFIPLFLACNPGVTDVYLTFDAMQAQGCFPTAPSLSRKHPSTSQWLGPLSDYYATDVVRTAQDVNDLFGLPFKNVPGVVRHRGQVIVVSQIPAGVPLLAVSPRFTETQNKGGQRADTFTECQGHTIHGDVCIDLGGLTATATEAAAWTALTRATGNIYLKMGVFTPKDTTIESSWASSQILTAMLTVASIRRNAFVTRANDVDGLVASAVLSHMSRSISVAAAARLGLPGPNPVIGQKGLGYGARSSFLREPHESGDYYTARTHRATGKNYSAAPGAAFSRHSAAPTTVAKDIQHMVRHFTDLCNESSFQGESTGYKLPPVPLLASSHDPMFDINEPTDDAGRERFLPNTLSTEQHVMDGAPDTLHHVRGDLLTERWGEEKRIRVGKYDKPWSKSDERRLKQLKRGFAKFVDVDAWNSQPFDHTLWEQCENGKIASWASKRTKRAIEKSVAKQNLDQPFNHAKLFMKGQYVKKQPKWRSSATASQIISDWHLGSIFKDGPFLLYVAKLQEAFSFETTMYYNKKSPDDLSRWYDRFWRPGKMTSCDYTAWDSGVDHVFVEFECWVWKLSKLPDEAIDAYRWVKLNTESRLGPHMPKMESGRFGTLDENSRANMGLTGATMAFGPRTPGVFCGDDGVVLGAWSQTVGFSPKDWLMQPKREVTTSTEFCGLLFGRDHISMDPAVVHWRSRFGLQQGRNDKEFWTSIRDAIRETAAGYGTLSPALAAARTNLHRAVRLFRLPRSLLIPDPPPERKLRPWDPVWPMVRWLFFL